MRINPVFDEKNTIFARTGGSSAGRGAKTAEQDGRRCRETLKTKTFGDLAACAEKPPEKRKKV